MEFNVIGRNVTITDRFREYVEERGSKIEHFAPKTQRVEVKVTRASAHQSAGDQITVEITVLGKGPAIRAEARSNDKFSAFDLAFGKLQERLRRARDKAKVHHGRHNPQPVNEAVADLPVSDSEKPLADHVRDQQRREEEESLDFTPVEIRRKAFPEVRMSVDDAVDNMELVGHPFYLFVDEESGRHSVVYRRKGWAYGVLTLDPEADGERTESVNPYRGATS